MPRVARFSATKVRHWFLRAVGYAESALLPVVRFGLPVSLYIRFNSSAS